MIKGIVIGAVGVILAGLAAGWIVVASGRAPVNADAQPSRAERWIATRALQAAVMKQAPQGDNPEAPTDANVIAGIHLYAENCAVCHGARETKPSNIALGLYQKPPQFGRHRAEKRPSPPRKPFPGGAYWIIAHGIRMTGMPAFSGTLSQDQIWKIALFLSRMDSLSPAAQKTWSLVKN